MRVIYGRTTFIITDQTTLFSMVEFLHLIGKANTEYSRLIFDAYFSGVKSIILGD